MRRDGRCNMPRHVAQGWVWSECVHSGGGGKEEAASTTDFTQFTVFVSLRLSPDPPVLHLCSLPPPATIIVIWSVVFPRIV